MARRMTHPAAGRVGHPPVPASPVPEGPAGAALTPHGTAASRPPRMWWVGLLLLPGGLLLALGLGIAWAGLVLLWPALRRMTATVGGPVVAPEQHHGGQDEPGPRIDSVAWDGAGGVRVITRGPWVSSASPRPRTPWASYGDMASSTGRHWEES